MTLYVIYTPYQYNDDIHNKNTFFFIQHYLLSTTDTEGQMAERQKQTLIEVSQYAF